MGLEHHLSPIAGHHPDMPPDAAVAVASPQSKRTLENQHPRNSLLTGHHTNNTALIDGQMTQGVEADEQQHDSQSSTASAEATTQAMTAGQAATSNGGARAAYVASQQQRVTTCNLSLLPPSN